MSATLTGKNLAARALLEWGREQAAAVDRQKKTEAGDIMRIWETLESFGITPDKDKTVRNCVAPYETCVPIFEASDTRGYSDHEDGHREWSGHYQPAVAAAIRHGQVWIVAEHAEDPKPGQYLPVAALSGLETIGQALSNGGHSDWTAPTVDDRVNYALGSVSGDRITVDGEAYLAGARAICAALLDVAAAVRESRVV